MSIDGISMAYTFPDAAAKGRKVTQFFDIMGSRGVYHDGWFADTFGPRIPWVPGLPKGIADWNPDNDVWELYNLDQDWSQANDLAAKMPERVAYMKNLFLVESAKNQKPSHRRRTVDYRAPPGRHDLPTIYRMDFQRAYRGDARVRRAEARKIGQQRQHGGDGASECQRGALRSRRIFRRPSPYM